MLGMLVVSHGRFAEELVNATRNIVGEVEALEAISIGWDDPVDDTTKRIEEAIRRVDRGRGVLLLTDMFGGTPSNLALSLHDPHRIEVVTGVNLPMLIKFANLRDELELAAAAARLAEQGRQAIHVATEILQGTGPAGEEKA